VLAGTVALLVGQSGCTASSGRCVLLKYCNRMALVLTPSYSYALIKPYAISQVLRLSLAHRYSTRPSDFTTISFQTKMGDNHLTTTVSPHTHNWLHCCSALRPIATSAYIQLLTPFSRTHCSRLPAYTVTFLSYLVFGASNQHLVLLDS
jgi:hypothetical protein